MGRSNSTHAHSNYLIYMRFIRINMVGTVLHYMYLVFVPYEDLSHVHFDGARTIGAHATLG